MRHGVRKRPETSENVRKNEFKSLISQQSRLIRRFRTKIPARVRWLNIGMIFKSLIQQSYAAVMRKLSANSGRNSTQNRLTVALDKRRLRRSRRTESGSTDERDRMETKTTYDPMIHPLGEDKTRLQGLAYWQSVEVERDCLRAENARLREALEKIASLQQSDVADLTDGSIIIRNRTATIARAALAEVQS